MGFLTDVYRTIKLNASAIPDLESEIFKNADSFEHAIELFISRFIADFRFVKIDEAVADIVRFKDKKQIIFDANNFACRVDRILAYRCMQYVSIVEHYKLHLLTPADRQKREIKALSYLVKMNNTLDIINNKAKQFIESFPKETDIRLHAYLIKLSVLDWEQVRTMLQKGEVPFRY